MPLSSVCPPSRLVIRNQNKFSASGEKYDIKILAENLNFSRKLLKMSKNRFLSDFSGQQPNF